ncbi:MAG: ComF family protein [Candidatus Cloacimonetes bacterium]|nr:ComF family protein [Candidatus Cloacimonadota bacterium]
MKRLSQLLDLFFPNVCIVCKEKLTNNHCICQKCLNELVLLDIKKCFFCGENPAQNGLCENCKKELHFDGLVSAYKFDNIIQLLIHNLKYNEYMKIGKHLGELLANRLSKYEFISDIDFIIPVPLHKVKERERGFNQSYLISKEISNILKIPLGKNIIKRSKYTKTQTKLTKEEREKNVGDAFEIKYPELVKEKIFLIVDDVITTGSTMKSIALLLKGIGARKFYAASISRA